MSLPIIPEIKLDKEEADFYQAYQAQIDTRLDAIGDILNSLDTNPKVMIELGKRVAELNLVSFKIGQMYALEKL